MKWTMKRKAGANGADAREQEFSRSATNGWEKGQHHEPVLEPCSSSQQLTCSTEGAAILCISNMAFNHAMWEALASLMTPSDPPVSTLFCNLGFSLFQHLLTQHKTAGSSLCSAGTHLGVQVLDLLPLGRCPLVAAQSVLGHLVGPLLSIAATSLQKREGKRE